MTAISNRTLEDFPPSGIYHLILHLSRARRIRVGALGVFLFPAGHYTYTGRAMRGLSARVARHVKRDKSLRWHIDYFRRHAKLIGVRIFGTNDPGTEETQAKILLGRARKISGDVALPAPGFGSSDSRAESHLIYWGSEFPVALENFEMFISGPR